MEKAHRDFSDILLQILDDGRLTDNKGRTIDFRNTIIMITTNSKNLEADFKPEVLGRLDGILTYQSLDASIMRSLIEKQLKLLNDRLLGKDLKIELDDLTFVELAKRGYDAKFGARPLQTVFNKYITRPLSRRILEGDLPKGNLKAHWTNDPHINICFE